MFKKILIANRGEVALRVIRACRELKIPTVAVYSEADTDSLHVKFADEAVCIGPSESSRSYLSIPNIISAAQVTRADAVHPGYGFLAENPEFAEVCSSCNLTFIGPSSQAMKLMGDKAEAKERVRKASVPVIPGTDGSIKTEKEALAFAASSSYPIIVKASCGGGGRGMRIVNNEKELSSAIRTASSESEAAFGDGRIYLEKYLAGPKHIEFQVLASEAGGIIHLGERDCSIQRRHQKLVEESPSLALDSNLRDKMGKAAVKVAKTISYTNAGTVEFLLSEDRNYYFMEMNTRVQVEHPVTEAITGIDIIKEQIRIAAGKNLGISQKDVKFYGHAMEFRINAEDPENNFLPSVGKIELYNPPGGLGVRVDSHLYSGYEVPSFYDSLLAKLIVWGRDRDEVIMRAKRALDEFIIVGVKTTIPFHLKVLDDAFFKKGKVYTDFIERRMQV